MNISVETLNKARAILDEKQAQARAMLKEAKTEAKRVRDEKKKNGPDKAGKKMADEVYKLTVREAEAECSRVLSAALKDWAEAYEEFRQATKQKK